MGPKQPFLSEEAVLDLEEIWSYISEDSVAIADSFIDRLYPKCLEIAELEGVGYKRDDLFPNLLSHPYKKYVIFFIRTKHRVEIVRILHGQRDIPSQFA